MTPKKNNSMAKSKNRSRAYRDPKPKPENTVIGKRKWEESPRYIEEKFTIKYNYILKLIEEIDDNKTNFLNEFDNYSTEVDDQEWFK